MTVVHAVILSVLQGAFELFPVSSLGHTVLVPMLLGWHEDESAPSFLAFVVVLHLGTATALLLFFWRNWLAIARAVFESIVARRVSDDPDEHLGWLIVVGSIPAGLLGLFFRGSVLALFAHGGVVAVLLILNGGVLLAGEQARFRSMRASARTVALGQLPLRQAFGIGAVQALALLPGFSRSGTSMVAGLLVRLDHLDAATLSFMMATPLILGAALLEVPELFAPNAQVGPGIAATGFVISAITAFLTVRFLMRFFRTERLDLFGYYCIVFGALAFGVLAARGAL